jgi:transglutaminase-like putative cysteine protease
MHLNLRWDTRQSKLWTKWMNRRRASDTHTLTANNIYALPTRAGWMMLVTTLVLMLATINYQLSLGYVLIFLLMGAGVVGLFLAYRELTRKRLTLSTAEVLRGKLGEEIDVLIQMGSVEQRLRFKLERVGAQPLPCVICETRYPLGLLRLWSVWRLASTVQVDPPDSDSGTRASHSQWTFAANLDAEMSPDQGGMKTDIRAYRVGDAPRDVLWKTVAKRPDTPSNWGVREWGDEPPEQTLHRAVPLPRHHDSQTDVDALRRAQEAVRMRDLTLLLALLFIALPFFQHLVWWYPLMACSLIAWRWWQIKTDATPAPKWLQPALIVTLGVLVWLPHQSFSGIEASVSACIGLLGIKALELPQNKNDGKNFTRDHWVLVYLGLFTLSAHFLVSQSLTSSVQVVLGLTALLYVLVLSHSKLPAKPHGLWPHPMRITLILVIFGAPFMAAMFFLFPRFSPLWSLQEQKTVSVTSLTSEMRVGDMGELTRDNKIVLRLEMDAPPFLDSKDIYLRSYVLPRFDGRTWTSYRSAKAQTLLDAPEHAGRGYAVMLEDGKPYPATIAADARSDAESRSLTYLQTALAVPAGSNPRTSQWLQSLREDARTKNFSSTDWSNYVLEVLRTGGYRYTLSPGTYGLHVVDELLFDRKLGFCEHYATAFVIAMRSLGIPARVVTGYQGAEINPIDGLQVVRNSNAHAWAEYWDGGRDSGAWQRVDPTAVVAPARIQNAESFNQAPQQLAQQGRGLWSSSLLTPVFKGFWRARQSWEATNHAWEAWFAGYNQAAQMSWLKRLGIDDPSWKDLVQLLDAVLLILLLLGVAIYAWRGSGKQDPWLALVEAIRDKALRQGVVIAENATPREIASKYPQHKQWLMDLESARYASPTAQKADLATLKRQFKKIFTTQS